jgi:hypothetical protein
VALILLAGVVIALLKAGPPVNGPLDPDDTGPFGTHALAALLRQRGQTVVRAGTVAGAAAQARGAGTTLVVTGPALLSRAELTTLAGTGASLLIVAPGPAALTALAPGVLAGGQVPVRSTAPGCGLPAARLAGTAAMGGVTLRSARAGAWRCYPARGLASLIRYRVGGRTVTALGTGAPLSNAYLAHDGNAALALNLLDGTPRIVWLVPSPFTAVAAHGQPRSLLSLLPRPVYLVAAELLIALLLAVLWRMRRFGPLVAEPLPVIVRASETVAGHGRLYQARRARDRAAAALRTATLTRITTRLGLPGTAPAGSVCAELAARTGREPGEIKRILFGPDPRDDAALVSLAAELDWLEGQVLTP